MKLLTSDELQQHLSISRTTLWRYRKAGLPTAKMPTRSVRFDLEQVRKWLEQQAKRAEGGPPDVL